MATDGIQLAQPSPACPGLKKIAPYWYPYTTMAKGRWLGREILEMVSTEFRDRSMEYYVGTLSLGSAILF
jgi:tRNA pseudouridine synthase 9